MNKRHTIGAAVSFAGLVLLARTPAVEANPINILRPAGQIVAGAPVAFTVTGAPPSSSIRIVVIPGGLAVRTGPAPEPLVTFGCYNGTPAALGVADATTDPSGNVGPTVVWASATPGTYVAYLLQGTCGDVTTGGRNIEASSDTRIIAADGFTVPESVPALSTLGLAAAGLALAAAGWAFLSRPRA